MSSHSTRAPVQASPELAEGHARQLGWHAVLPGRSRTDTRDAPRQALAGIIPCKERKQTDTRDAQGQTLLAQYPCQERSTKSSSCPKSQLPMGRCGPVCTPCRTPKTTPEVRASRSILFESPCRPFPRLQNANPPSGPSAGTPRSANTPPSHPSTAPSCRPSGTKRQFPGR